MTLATANAYAASLASTQMVAIVIFRAGDGTMSVMPAAEYDGDDDTIVAELEHIFTHELGNAEGYARTYGDTPFGLLVRKLVHLGRGVVQFGFLRRGVNG